MANNKRLRVSAILIGVLADLGCTALVVTAFSLVAAIHFASQGMNAADFQAQFPNSVLYLVVAMVTGSLCTVLGGYVAAALGRERRLHHALWMGILGELFAVAMLIATKSTGTPLWYQVISLAVIIPLAVLGGTLRQAQDRA